MKKSKYKTVNENEDLPQVRHSYWNSKNDEKMHLTHVAKTINTKENIDRIESQSQDKKVNYRSHFFYVFIIYRLFIRDQTCVIVRIGSIYIQTPERKH